MPRRPLPTLTLSVGLAVVLVAVLPPARAQDADPKRQAAADRTHHSRARAELTDGSSVVGTLRLAAIGLRTETDTRAIDLKHVRRVTFQREPGGRSQDTVQLDDKSVVRGRVMQDAFEVQTDDGVRAVRSADLREVRLLREEWVSPATVALGLLTLAAMEIVLGIDNIIFLAIIAGKLPEPQQPRARRIGLVAALGTRLVLLFTLSFLLGLTRPLFTLPDLPLLHDLEAREVSWRDLILLGGGLFLIGKSVREMHEKLEEAKAGRAGRPAPAGKPAGFAKTIVMIAVIDIVFSLDSVITAVGMVEQLWVMVVAMVIAMLVMLWFSGPISRFVDRNPTIKVLALAFLILIGVMLVAEGLGQHIDKGYIYFAMAFAVGIEMINMRVRKAHAKAEKPA
jgi:predicted tellurium resistance membrane protein TerC